MGNIYSLTQFKETVTSAPFCAFFAAGGVLSMTQNDPDQNYFWWHGPYTPDNPGGEPWDQDAALHGMPCTGIGLTWKKQVLEILAECGHRIEYGYAKLTPIAT